MSSMNLLFIGDTNTYAASLFERGSHAYAKTKFAEALQRVHGFITARELNLVHTEDVILQGGKMRCFSDTPLINSPYPSYVYAVAPCSQKKDGYREQEIYGAAFLLSSDIPVVAEAVAAVLSFNLGLHYHKRAMQAEKRESYEKALGLYQESLALLERRAFNSSDALLVLEAALYYNQAHIHQVFMDDTATAVVFMAKLKEPVRCMAKSENVLVTDLCFFENGLSLFEDAVNAESWS